MGQQLLAPPAKKERASVQTGSIQPSQQSLSATATVRALLPSLLHCPNCTAELHSFWTQKQFFPALPSCSRRALSSRLLSAFRLSVPFQTVWCLLTSAHFAERLFAPCFIFCCSVDGVSLIGTNAARMEFPLGLHSAASVCECGLPECWM